MIQEQTQAESIRRQFLTTMHLTKQNRKIADLYLDMEQPEQESLLVEIEHQDLSKLSHYLGTGADYPGWLRKKKQTEELKRYVRFIVEVGGSTACELLVQFEACAAMSRLMQPLAFLTGEHAEDQKLAVQTGFCTLALLRMRPEDVKALCRSGAGDPEIFLRAQAYCYDIEGEPGRGKWSRSRMLLQAMYLFHKEPGTAPETAVDLEESLIAALGGLMPFRKPELQYIQNYVRTADRDTPFPQKILSIYQERKTGINPSLLAGCAFLALRHSVRFELLLRLMAAVDTVSRFQGRNFMLESCRGIVDEQIFDRQMDQIEDMLPVPDEDYILWCLGADYKAGVNRMAVKCPDGMRAALQKAESGAFEDLMELLSHANPELYEEFKPSRLEHFREKTASELVRRVVPGREKARDYLLGLCPVRELLPYMKEWRYDYYQEQGRYEKIERLKRQPDGSMYRRAVILEALKKQPDYLEQYPVYDEADGTADANNALLLDGRQIRGLLRICETEQISVRMQAEALGGLSSSADGKKKKELLMNRFAQIWAGSRKGRENGSWEEGMAAAVREGSPEACCLCLKVLSQCRGGACKEIYLSCAGNSSKLVREQLLKICGEHPEWEPEVLLLLTSKKVKEREFAVSLLEEWGSPSCLSNVKEALAGEKNQKLAARLQTLAGELKQEAEGADADASGRARREEEKLAAGILRGNRKRKVEWVQSLALPEVHRRDGETVPAEYLLALLAAYADMEPLGIHPDAVKLAAPLHPEELSAYMQALFEGWAVLGAEAKKRWVLYAVSVHGGQRMVSVLHRQIRDWAEHQRGAMAAETTKALALNGSPEALVLVDQMSRKFPFRQIKNAAGSALQNAASALGISREELEDRLVPDLGFDDRMERHFDYGPRSFTVRLNRAPELEICDGSGKRLKNLPSPGKQDDPERAAQASLEFRQLKKQLKEVLSSQKLRLEQALSSGRFWEAEKWKALFVQNPVMHLFAESLIWGMYEDQKLCTAFRCLEDGSFSTAEETEYELSENGKIGLVHPLELTAEEIAAWKEQLSDYEIVQPFDQLGRPVYRVTKEERQEGAVSRFEDRMLNGLSLSGRLLGMGWFRGEILDAGFYEKYYRADGAFGAELSFSGSSVGYENEEVTVHKVSFYRLGQTEPGSAPHPAFREEDRRRPEEVPARYFSEVLRQVEMAVGV